MIEGSAISVVIEQLRAGDEERLRDTRLRALRESPEAFGTTLAEASRWSADHWQQQLRTLATFVATLGHADVGLARGVASEEDPTAAYLISMWVAPAVRRRGVGRRLIGAVGNWAEEVGFATLRLDVVENNSAAIALYDRTGFRRTGRRGAPPSASVHPQEIEMELMLPHPDRIL